MASKALLTMSLSFTRKLLAFLIAIIFQTGLFAQGVETDPDFSDSEGVNTGSKISLVANLPNDYSSIDKYSLGLKNKYKKIPELAKDLTAPFTNDQDKVRSIFIWLTDNIAYNCSEFHSQKAQRVSFSYRTAAELNDKRNKFYYEYATRVLKTCKGICEGYAVLFQQLCLANNIPCEIVIGTASFNTAKIARLKGKKNFSTNHAWVKVKLDNKWFYVDPTWASGYCDRSVRHFYKEYNEEFYLTPIDKLYPTHAVNEKETEKRNNVFAKNH
jgi:transglutaminase/protease-like cytokinesis protein 3